MEQERSLPAIFLRTSAALPDAIALETSPAPGERLALTYAELEDRARGVARALEDLVGTDEVVAICADRAHAELYIAQLGVLFAGAAHLCLDPALPPDRLRVMVEDAAPKIALYGPGHADLVRALGMPVEPRFAIDRIASGLDPEPVVRPRPDALAYLIYTSGTTGKPKGVEVSHRAIANLIEGDRQHFDLGPGDRVAQVSSPAYDSSLEETWLAFGAGATLLPMDAELARSGPDVVEWLRRERISVFCPPPTLLRATGCSDPAAALPDLRLLYVGGEALPRDVADRWSRGRRLVNGYGPTEAAVTALRAEIRPDEPITIGHPVPGATAHVLDEELCPVAAGEVGELCLGGVGLARGYRGAPELTAARFVEHPRLGRLYRTGDLARIDEAGRHQYLGRADGQVKLRGHRIELAEIEVALCAQPGVRQAVAAVQAEATARRLVAFVVAESPASPPDKGGLKAALRARLPEVMIPAEIGFLEHLPASAGGKLDRGALPELMPEVAQGAPATGAGEEIVAAAVAEACGLPTACGREAHFFDELGLDSVGAAVLVTALRERPEFAGLSVREVYESPTVAALAARASTAPELSEPSGRSEALPPLPSRVRAGCVQAAILLGFAAFAAPLVGVLVLVVFPWLLREWGLTTVLLLIPILALPLRLLGGALALGATLLAKRVLIGRYEAGAHPVYGGFWLRQWTVNLLASGLPLGLLQGTEWASWVLRRLGARVGRGVHVHAGVNLSQGGWDLLSIGEGATLQQEAAVRLTTLSRRQLVLAPVTIGQEATVGVRAALSGGSALADGARLEPLACLEAGETVRAGERWGGVPARRLGENPPPPSVDRVGARLGLHRHALHTLLCREALAVALGLPLAGGLLLAARAAGTDGAGVLEWMRRGPSVSEVFSLLLPLVLGMAVLGLAWSALVTRWLAPRRAGVLDRLAPGTVRVALTSGLVAGANRWLSGTVFWPWWLRAAGARVGRRAEVSTIIDVQPGLLEIGPDSFLADGIYPGGAERDRGTVRLGSCELGERSFIGNHVVIPPGFRGGEDLLIGVCTVADPEAMARPGAWFGEPPFRLQRPTRDDDERLTLRPSAIRRANRVFWELLRFPIPLPPLLVFVLWFEHLGRVVVDASTAFSLTGLLWVLGSGLGIAVGTVAGVIALKWALIGRARPGEHALWSCWCSRWDFLYVAWGAWARAFLTPLQGTPLLAPVLRLFGVRIGRGVVLGGGFAQVVDPDMIAIRDGATVSALFQAHSFEERVLKLDHLVIGPEADAAPGALLFYGVQIGERARVHEHAVAMKNERLLPHVAYEGIPTRPRRR